MDAKLLYWTGAFVNMGVIVALAFAGVGAGAILILPWVQSIIDADGWRDACWAMALLCICVVLLKLL